MQSLSRTAQVPLTRLQRGIEKESLRILPNGQLADTAHPATLGAPLTHPQITTDFSESQLELITGVHKSVDACLGELTDIHRYVYANIGTELLWPASMPCMLPKANEIPLGQYGSSNVAQSKTVYRRGLANRYGAVMQTISGIHYNFSVPEELLSAIGASTQDDRTKAYFDLIRNFRRYTWLLIYLFGASPAICRSFDVPGSNTLAAFDEGSLHHPYATSLRMGPLGYQSSAQQSLHVSYNSLNDYAATMREALTTSYAPYEAIGVLQDGEYQQLNTSLIQIENEFYGSIRPKRPVASGERPLTALTNRGVEYVEVRCIDLNPYLPIGLDAAQVRFLDLFLLYCLLADSPPDTKSESLDMQQNQVTTVQEGRNPSATLKVAGRPVALKDWGQAILDAVYPLAELMDEAHSDTAYVRRVAGAGRQGG